MKLTYSGEKMYVLIFVKLILTDQGRKIVHSHKSDKYTQKVYTNISYNLLKYTKGWNNSTKILTCITSDRVGDVTWPENIEIFILNSK